MILTTLSSRVESSVKFSKLLVASRGKIASSIVLYRLSNSKSSKYTCEFDFVIAIAQYVLYVHVYRLLSTVYCLLSIASNVEHETPRAPVKTCLQSNTNDHILLVPAMSMVASLNQQRFLGSLVVKYRQVRNCQQCLHR